MKAHSNRNKDKTGLCFLLLCVMGLVCSCSREDGLPVDGNPVDAAFAGSFVREGWGDAGRAGTRVSDGTWTEGDAVGVYMVPISSYALTGAMWKNRKQVIGSDNKMTPDGIANKLYYPLNGDEVRFVAYYPYATSPTHPDSLNKVSFDFADQSTKTKKEAKDFMFHRGTEDYSNAKPNASLGFHHKFSKILMTVNRGDGWPGWPSLSDLAVTLGGMPASATVDLDKLAQQQSGDITVGSTTADITAFTLSSTTETATVEAIVAPHKGEGTGGFSGRTFTFTAGDETKSYELPDTVTFSSGYAYHFTFSLVPGTKVPDGMTNCYMVVPGQSVTFPVSRAYKYTGTVFTDTLHVDYENDYTGEFTADVVWQDADVINGTPTVSGFGNAAKVTVQTNNASGNVVVAIKKGSDIVWSYHIWVTDYDATDSSKRYTNSYTYNSTNYAFVFMDRNLGATQAGRPTSTGAGANAGFGLFYQWGRKDPFPATGNPGDGMFTAEVTSSSIGTIVYTLQHPNTFLATDRSYDWLYVSSNNELWDHSGVKTIYDPCPVGWQVPRDADMSGLTNPWYGFSISNGTWSNGYNWGTNAEYPAAGYRNYSSGSVESEGVFGVYWSALPRDDSYSASNVGFTSGYIFVNYANFRAYGFNVRCVRE